MSQKTSYSKGAKRPHPRFQTVLLQYDEKLKKMVPAESVTDQSAKKETDINTIIKRQLPIPDADSMIFADETVMADFQQQADMVSKVHEQFDELPANLRYRFENDPNNLLQFMSDPQNDEESIKLGLRPKPKPDPEIPPGSNNGDSPPPMPKPDAVPQPEEASTSKK